MDDYKRYNYDKFIKIAGEIDNLEKSFNELDDEEKIICKSNIRKLLYGILVVFGGGMSCIIIGTILPVLATIGLLVIDNLIEKKYVLAKISMFNKSKMLHDDRLNELTRELDVRNVIEEYFTKKKISKSNYNILIKNKSAIHETDFLELLDEIKKEYVKSNTIRDNDYRVIFDESTSKKPKTKQMLI